MARAYEVPASFALRHFPGLMRPGAAAVRVSACLEVEGRAAQQQEVNGARIERHSGSAGPSFWLQLEGLPRLAQQQLPPSAAEAAAAPRYEMLASGVLLLRFPQVRAAAAGAHQQRASSSQPATARPSATPAAEQPSGRGGPVMMCHAYR